MAATYRSLATLAFAGAAMAGSITDIDHIVLFMQENRAFDHYFGTMAGVRNFADPNVQYNGNTSVFYQNVNSQLSNATDYLLPFYLNYLGGTWENATQCMVAGSNGWSANHDALNGGLNNQWAIGNTPYSWGHFTREELPNHFAIAEGFTVGDMYQEGVIASTNPNRVTWASGTINAPGSPPGAGKGGMYIDNNETPGCEAPGLDCYPLEWTTTIELLQNAGISWEVYQDTDNFDDNPFAWFSQFQTALPTSPLSKALTYPGLEKFYSDAAAGTLPAISYIIGPAELSEHPPYQPKDGAWLQQKVVDSVVQSPKYANTALIISYDETGGWGDHVIPFHSPNGTVGEWVEDPYGQYGYVPTGPGFRLPFYIISPWTRGGHVFAEHADHNSQIKFLETWAAANGHNITSPEMNPWRRAHMSDLTRAFDFAYPDYSIPIMPNISYPSTSSTGQWDGYAVCESDYATTSPPVPYGQQTLSSALATEQGFKQLRGNPTEGRYLTFESQGYALSNVAGNLSSTRANAAHNSLAQRFVLHAANISTSTTPFSIASAVDGSFITGPNARNAKNGTLASAAPLFEIADLGNGKGYVVQSSSSKNFVTVSSSGAVSWSATRPANGFQIFSVTYAS